MSGAGAPDLSVDASGTRVAIIAGHWHDEILTPMIEEAQRAVAASGATAELFRVAGAFEMPLAAQAALSAAPGDEPRFDAAVCLGVIVRGGTPHFDYVCNAVTDGLTRVQLDTGRPVGFGVLTVDTEQQALDRSGRPGAPESKGREAAEAALHLLATMRAIRG
ncbi:6,7-dimethyl-8-ribityllumazine synthase [Leucobacter exalbidus]|uniref:6,7-dimethyl-8-ribityllumazine synthase n=1 Tax=Leucobacter exalbidus TaxID=662960 RepID=A0A940T4C8_9MICO|nr:6,7-dimethyl-8-ribityllumazine synthase [Leucobacter exalbidus]MBP1326778.1 6,7-dimethyl-8-ribityllumazine synthase [Leucobacter exalbidus]